MKSQHLRRPYENKGGSNSSTQSQRRYQPMPMACKEYNQGPCDASPDAKRAHKNSTGQTVYHFCRPCIIMRQSRQEHPASAPTATRHTGLSTRPLPDRQHD
ncbi:hypothetical protein Bbelb_317350 [Branchiostoma belcheri]|nr:hypothetical protein Bbelb_344130 [Branchiostoma belcheri]KAI8490467.1 hypothetical protein Bbelb_317350 [Branchiostoma belcheri]